MPNEFREVIWLLPKGLYENLENTKEEAQKRLVLPLEATTEKFAMFLLDRMLQLYREAQLPEPKPEPSRIIDPGSGVLVPQIEYRGMRTPQR